jgi:hypothetical protein
MHSDLRMEKKFSAMALSYGFARLDMDGVMPYCLGHNIALRSILKALVTVELQLGSDLFFFHCHAKRIQHQFDILASAGFIGNNASVKQVVYDGKVKSSLLD